MKALAWEDPFKRVWNQNRRRTLARASEKAAAVPEHAGLGTGAARDELLGGGQLASFLSRSAGATGALGRRGIQVGVGPAAADQGGVAGVAMTAAGQLMGGIAAISQKDEFPFGKPVPQHGHELPGQAGGGLVAGKDLPPPPKLAKLGKFGADRQGAGA